MVNGEKSVEDSKETLERLIVEGDVEGSSLKPGTRLVTIGVSEVIGFGLPFVNSYSVLHPHGNQFYCGSGPNVDTT